MPSIYADATPLIGLARIGRLDLLTLLPTPILVTVRVWNEMVSDPMKPGVAALRRAEEEHLLKVVAQGNPNAFPQLDAGESTVLSAAMAAHAAVLIDERKARACISADPLLRATIPQVTGLVGLLLLAKGRGAIPAVRPLLDDLVRQHFWISPSFYHEILHQAGES